MRFYTLLSPGFQTKLYLPAEFCTKARADFSTEAVVVTRSGKWIIKAHNDGGHFNFCGDGWAKFVNDHDLEEGGLLEFKHQGFFLFHATIYYASGCNIRGETVPPSRVPKPRNQQNVNANPIFIKLMRDCTVCEDMPSMSRLVIPKKIWKLNNLQEKKAAVLRIRSLETMEWPAKIEFYEYDPGHGSSPKQIMWLKQGWHDFATCNNIKKGDKCTFEIIVDASPDYSHKVVIIYVTKE